MDIEAHRVEGPGGKVAAMALVERITVDPAVLVGKPTIRGLRISVEQVLKALANGVTEAELLDDYPELEPEDVRACFAYAAERIAEERVYPLAS
jgi:uncharacterized protein (DUF433 family)